MLLHQKEIPWFSAFIMDTEFCIEVLGLHLFLNHFSITFMIFDVHKIFDSCFCLEIMQEWNNCFWEMWRFYYFQNNHDENHSYYLEALKSVWVLNNFQFIQIFEYFLLFYKQIVEKCDFQLLDLVIFSEQWMWFWPLRMISSGRKFLWNNLFFKSYVRCYFLCSILILRNFFCHLIHLCIKSNVFG